MEIKVHSAARSPEQDQAVTLIWSMNGRIVSCHTVRSLSARGPSHSEATTVVCEVYISRRQKCYPDYTNQFAHVQIENAEKQAWICFACTLTHNYSPAHVALTSGPVVHENKLDWQNELGESV